MSFFPECYISGNDIISCKFAEPGQLCQLDCGPAMRNLWNALVYLMAEPFSRMNETELKCAHARVIVTISELFLLSLMVLMFYGFSKLIDYCVRQYIGEREEEEAPGSL